MYKYNAPIKFDFNLSPTIYPSCDNSTLELLKRFDFKCLRTLENFSGSLFENSVLKSIFSLIEKKDFFEVTKNVLSLRKK